MTFIDFVSLRKTLLGPVKGELTDYYLTLGKRVIMFVFWILDFSILLQRTNILKGELGYLTKTQMRLYIVNLVFSFILQLRTYNAVQYSENMTDIEKDNFYNKKKEAVISMIKIICDLMSALDGSGIVWALFKTHFNEAFVSIASLISAFISLRWVFSSVNK